VIDDGDREMDAVANVALRHRIDQGAMEMSMEQLRDHEGKARKTAGTRSDKDSR
jgi:hypothetical protein